MSEWERIDEDESAETGDTRLRVSSGRYDTYVVMRERYCLVEFESENVGESDDGHERYDWSVDSQFVLYGSTEAEQFARMLSDEGAFDPNVLFFRQREWDDE